MPPSRQKPKPLRTPFVPKEEGDFENANKALRNHFEKTKTQGYKDKQAALKVGKDHLYKLLQHPDLPENMAQDWCQWCEEQLDDLITDLPPTLVINYHYAALQCIVAKIIKPAIESTEGERTPSPVVVKRRPGVHGTLQLAAVMVCPLVAHLKTMNGGANFSRPKELHSREWIELIVFLLDVVRGGEIGGHDATSSLSDLLYELVTDKANDEGRVLILKKEICGPSRLGDFLWGSMYGALSVNILRILGALHHTPGNHAIKDSLLKDATRDKGWEGTVGDQLCSLLKRAKPDPKSLNPRLYMSLVNMAFNDKRLDRPKGFQISALEHNGKDWLKDSPSLALFDENGIEDDAIVTFRQLSTLQRNDCTFTFDLEPSQNPGTKVPLMVTLWDEAQADEFEELFQARNATYGTEKSVTLDQDPNDSGASQCDEEELSELARVLDDVEAKVAAKGKQKAKNQRDTDVLVEELVEQNESTTHQKAKKSPPRSTKTRKTNKITLAKAPTKNGKLQASTTDNGDGVPSPDDSTLDDKQPRRSSRTSASAAKKATAKIAAEEEGNPSQPSASGKSSAKATSKPRTESLQTTETVIPDSVGDDRDSNIHFPVPTQEKAPPVKTPTKTFGKAHRKPKPSIPDDSEDDSEDDEESQQEEEEQETGQGAEQDDEKLSDEEEAEDEVADGGEDLSVGAVQDLGVSPEGGSKSQKDTTPPSSMKGRGRHRVLAPNLKPPPRQKRDTLEESYETPGSPKLPSKPAPRKASLKTTKAKVARPRKRDSPVTDTDQESQSSQTPPAPETQANAATADAASPVPSSLSPPPATRVPPKTRTKPNDTADDVAGPAASSPSQQDVETPPPASKKRTLASAPETNVSEVPTEKKKRATKAKKTSTTKADSPPPAKNTSTTKADSPPPAKKVPSKPKKAKQPESPIDEEPEAEPLPRRTQPPKASQQSKNVSPPKAATPASRTRATRKPPAKSLPTPTPVEQPDVFSDESMGAAEDTTLVDTTLQEVNANVNKSPAKRPQPSSGETAAQTRRSSNRPAEEPTRRSSNRPAEEPTRRSSNRLADLSPRRVTNRPVEVRQPPSPPSRRHTRRGTDKAQPPSSLPRDDAAFTSGTSPSLFHKDAIPTEYGFDTVTTSTPRYAAPKTKASEAQMAPPAPPFGAGPSNRPNYASEREPVWDQEVVEERGLKRPAPDSDSDTEELAPKRSIAFGSRESALKRPLDDDSEPRPAKRIRFQTPSRKPTRSDSMDREILHESLGKFTSVLEEIMMERIQAPNKQMQIQRRTLARSMLATATKWTKETEVYTQMLRDAYVTRREAHEDLKHALKATVDESKLRHATLLERVNQGTTMGLPKTLF